MEPSYHDGELVLFSSAAVESVGVRSGDDCGFYLAGGDGRTTFKRVHIDPADPTVFVLRCLNRTKYKTEMRVRREDVLRVGKALWVMRSARN